jgi:hypothetical protein
MMVVSDGRPAVVKKENKMKAVRKRNDAAKFEFSGSSSQ